MTFLKVERMVTVTEDCRNNNPCYLFGGVMKRIIIGLLVVGGISFPRGSDTSGVRRGGAAMSRKEIMRPMILPKGGWQISQTAGVGYYHENSTGRTLTLFRSTIGDFAKDARNKFTTYGSVFALLPRFSVSERVEFSAFPVPYVNVLITGSDIGYRTDGTLNRFAMTFHGGISGLSIANLTNVTLNFASGISTKLLISSRWWHEQHLNASYISSCQGLSLSERIGLQCTEMIAVTVATFGGMEWRASVLPETRFAAGGDLHCVAYLSPWFSIDVFTGGQAVMATQTTRRATSASVGSRLIVQW